MEQEAGENDIEVVVSESGLIEAWICHGLRQLFVYRSTAVRDDDMIMSEVNRVIDRVTSVRSDGTVDDSHMLDGHARLTIYETAPAEVTAG